MNVLSPFNKIIFESYSLEQGTGFAELVSNVFSKAKIENTNASVTIPFPRLTTTEIEVWKAYCPTQSKLEKTTCAIHTEALKLIGKYTDRFDWYEVWYEAGDQVDPVLVGRKYKDEDYKAKGYEWNAEHYLLCRWGEALKPFNEIKQQVFDGYVRRERVRLQKDLNNLEFDAMQKFGI